jgi:phage baseplate assembly protein W
MTVQIDYPYHFDTRFRTASTTYDEHVRDMIEQFLLTEPGERVNRPDFGGGLAQLVFAPNSPELAAALQFSVRAGLQRWLGDVIEVTALEVTAEDSTLTVDITYRLRATGEERTDRFERTQ